MEEMMLTLVREKKQHEQGHASYKAHLVRFVRGTAKDALWMAL